MDNNKFTPYVPSDKITSEITPTSIITGILLAVVFGAANAYLGLRVGMTVSASIPAAVVAMGVIRVILKRNSILESNIVQTIGSAGESLAAGSIFTLPALFLWAQEGKMNAPGILEISLIALLGGLLGVFFMIPLRNALIVKEHGVLPYPEGTACAEVLLAGEEGGNQAFIVFSGMGISAFFNFIIDGLKLAKGSILITVKGFFGAIGTRVYPAILSVGYICGEKIASYMFAGGILSWLVLIPTIVMFGENLTLYPAAVSVGELYNTGGASAIWNNYIKYIGAGALAAGGIISLIKSLPLIVSTFSGAVKNIYKTKTDKKTRTEQDINIVFVITAVLILMVLIWLIPAIPISLIGAFIVVIFGFFFATVSSRMVGLVGSSNNPVSGMAIATLLLTTLILKFIGTSGVFAMHSAIAIGSVICIICSVSGDTSQDLKTGFILGATPKKQQISEIIGAFASALAIGATLYLLNKAWGFGSDRISAPQATLMKLIVEGVMEGNLPWGLVFIGVFISVIIELLRVPVLPFAIGVYLPIDLSACIMIGGLVRLITEKKSNKNAVNRGILFSSGMIAGEGLIGIILAIFAIIGIEDILDMSGLAFSPTVGAAIILILTIALIFKFSFKKPK